MFFVLVLELDLVDVVGFVELLGVVVVQHLDEAYVEETIEVSQRSQFVFGRQE